MTVSKHRGREDFVLPEDLYPPVCAAVTQKLMELARSMGPAFVEFVQSNGRRLSLNPANVVSVEELPNDRTRVRMTAGAEVLDEPYATVIAAIQAAGGGDVLAAWPQDQETVISGIAARITRDALLVRDAEYHNGGS